MDVGHSRHPGRPEAVRPLRPASVLTLPANSSGPLRAPLSIPVATRCTTLVGPNASGKSNVLDALAAILRTDRPDAAVIHVPAGAVAVELAGQVLGDDAGPLPTIWLEEARLVVPEVTSVVVDLPGGTLSAQDRHGLTFSASAGLRASLALALARTLAAQGHAIGAILVEEPGAFLHPAAQEALRERLTAVSALLGAPILVTSESPFVIPRGADDLVIALARSTQGHPEVVGEAAGDDPHASLIGGLFRDPGLGAVLDRAARLVPGTRGIVVFEGGTDEAYLRLAADVLGRADALEGLAIVPAGGASAAALQAVVLRAETDLPLLVILDNDEPGHTARDTLIRRLGFEKRREATTYAEVLPGYPPDTEAEDMFDHRFVARFVEEAGPDAISGKRILYGRDDDDAVWHYDLTSASKSAFVRWAREHAEPDDVPGWADLLDLLAERLAPTP